MGGDRSSLRPIPDASRFGRARLGLRDELMLALLPTATILIVLWTVDTLANERVLFAALASSAFLIYLDPMHGTNAIRAVTGAHLTGALAGMLGGWLLGSGYSAAGLAMVLTILVMIVGDIVHPPAIGTTLTFAYRAGLSANIALFAVALGMVVVLIVLQRVTQHLLARFTA